MLGHVLPEEAGSVRKKVRVVTVPSAADDALTVRRYLSTTFVAHSERIWRSRRLARQALAQAEAWIARARHLRRARPSRCGGGSWSPSARSNAGWSR